MSDLPNPPAAPQSRRFRFSLLGLFFLTLGVGAGVGTARLSRWDIDGGVCTAIAVWLAIGLTYQSYDLAAWFRRGAHELGLRAAVVWALLWRCGGIAVSLGYVVCKFWGHTHRVPSDQIEIARPEAVREITEVLLALTLLSVVFPGGWRAPAHSSLWRRFVGSLALLASALLVVVIVLDKLSIAMLVHFAIRGVELQEPYRSLGAEVYSAGPEPLLQAQFVRRGLMMPLVLVAALALLAAVSQRWHRRGLERMLTAAGLVVTLVTLTVALGWAASTAFPRLSPFLFPTIPLLQPQFVLLGVICLGAFASVAAWRLAVGQVGDHSSRLVWRPAERQYCHEFLLLALLPFSTIFALRCWTAWEYRSMSPTSSIVTDVIAGLSSQNSSFMWLAVFVAGASQLSAWFFYKSPIWSSELAPLPCGRFVVLWLAVFWTTLLAGPTLAWLAASLWLLPTLPPV